MSNKKSKNQRALTQIERERIAFEREEHRKSILVHPGHVPVSRRDFIANGTIAMTGMVMMPSLLSMLASENVARAEGLSCPPPPLADMPAFLLFDLAGGAGIAGNFVPLNSNNETLSAPAGTASPYRQLGMGANITGSYVPPMERRFGAPMLLPSAGQTRVRVATAADAANMGGSGILAGILDHASEDALRVTRMGFINTRTVDDTGSNQHSPLLSIAKAGLAGSLVRGPTGMSDNRSGGNTDVPLYDANLKPLVVNTVRTVNEAASFGPSLSVISQTAGGNLTRAQLEKLVATTKDLSKAQLQQLGQMSYADQYRMLTDCSYGQSQNRASIPADGGNPSDVGNEAYVQLYGLNNATRLDDLSKNLDGSINTGQRSSVPRIATIVMNAIKGTTGPGVITFGGCDYHNGLTSRANRLVTDSNGNVLQRIPGQGTDNTDYNIGRHIGLAIQAAFLARKQLVFGLITDGAVSSDNGVDWQSDSSARSMTVLGVVDADPSKRTTQELIQIGSFTNGGVVDAASVVGADPRMASHTMLANYLAIAGKLDLINKVLPTNALRASDLQKILMFSKRA